MKIIEDIEQLRQPCKDVKTVEEGEEIGQLLLRVLSECDNGVGLAANQIGIQKRVCVIKVNDPIVLVNPRIISKFKKINCVEACLSFPGDYIITERYANIMVRADNHEETLIFSQDKNLLECVCVQHEIDHLSSVTMFDRMVKENNIAKED